MSDTYGELEYLANTLRGYHEECVESVVDLSGATFHCTDTSMYIQLRDTPFARKELHFRINPHDPDDDLATHAHKQLCRVVGVPYKFFKDNRPSMRETIVNTWLTGLVPGAEDSLRMFRVRNCREYTVVRAIIPHNMVDYPNYRAVSSLIKDGRDFGMVMASSVGDEMDALATEVAVKIGDPIEWGGRLYRMGMVMTISDLATEPIVVEGKIIADGDSEAFTVSFDYEHMLELPYTAMSHGDIDKVLSGLSKQLMDLRPMLVDHMMQAHSMEFRGLEESTEMVCSTIKSASVVKKIRREFLRTDAHEQYGTALDFARGLASLAKSYSGKPRNLLEKTAGSFLGLDLPSIQKKTTEEKKNGV
jgi:hypothetical protein